MAASLNDQAVLKANQLFINRVGVALVAACVSIKNEGSTAATESLHARRAAFAVSVLTNPPPYAILFAGTVATDASVIGDATTGGTVVLVAPVDVQQALVTDAHINTAIASQFNSYFGS